MLVNQLKSKKEKQKKALMYSAADFRGTSSKLSMPEHWVTGDAVTRHGHRK